MPDAVLERYAGRRVWKPLLSAIAPATLMHLDAAACSKLQQGSCHFHSPRSGQVSDSRAKAGGLRGDGRPQLTASSILHSPGSSMVSLGFSTVSPVLRSVLEVRNCRRTKKRPAGRLFISDEPTRCTQ